MNLDFAKERLLEIENLTDALEDDDANWLISWAIGKMALALEESSDAVQVDRVISLTRHLNQSAKHPTTEQTAAFLTEFEQTFHVNIGAHERTDVIANQVAALQGKSPREVMTGIVALTQQQVSHTATPDNVITIPVNEATPAQAMHDATPLYDQGYDQAADEPGDQPVKQPINKGDIANKRRPTSDTILDGHDDERDSGNGNGNGNGNGDDSGGDDSGGRDSDNGKNDSDNHGQSVDGTDPNRLDLSNRNSTDTKHDEYDEQNGIEGRIEGGIQGRNRR